MPDPSAKPASGSLPDLWLTAGFSFRTDAMTTQAFLTPSDIVIKPGRNPFSRMVVLDYYDGPVSGAAQCPSGPAFQFEMLAWDDRQDTRVFSLAALPPENFERLTEALSRFGEPRWPVWAPNWGEASQENETLEREVERLLNRAEAPEWIAAWRDLEGDGLLAARQVSPRLLDPPNASDWFSVLGLAA